MPHFKKYSDLMGLNKNSVNYNRWKALWECKHDWVDSFRDIVRYINFSPEHDTLETRRCLKCDIEEEFCTNCMGGGIIPYLSPKGHTEVRCEKCEGNGYV